MLHVHHATHVHQRQNSHEPSRVIGWRDEETRPKSFIPPMKPESDSWLYQFCSTLPNIFLSSVILLYESPPTTPFFTRVDSTPTHTHSVHVCIPYHDTQAGCRARSRCSCKFFPVNPSACSRVRSWSGQHCLLKTLLPDGYHAREHLDLHRARQNHLENFKNKRYVFISKQ